MYTWEKLVQKITFYEENDCAGRLQITLFFAKIVHTKGARRVTGKADAGENTRRRVSENGRPA